MKKTILAALAVMFSACLWAQDGEWTGLGTGAYQPGLLDYYSDEYPDMMPAAVYESSAHPGVYKFVPTAPAPGSLVPYEVVVHTENPDRVWCEDATFFRGIMNFNTRHKVAEAQAPYGISDDNYGKLKDGAITFTTPGSFLAMEMAGYKPTNLNGRFALYLPGVNPMASGLENDTWTAMGKGKYVEGLLDCEYRAGIKWDVEVEQSVEHPGCYRFKPYPAGNPSCPNLPEIADVYVYVHADNDMEVYTDPVLFLNKEGKGYKVEHRAVSGDSPDYSFYGTLEDGVITFPANSHVANVVGVPGVSSVLTNTFGKATLALPGSDYKDYYVEGVHPICAEHAGQGFCSFPFMIKGGADVAGAAVFVEAGTFTADQIDPANYLTSDATVYPSAFFGFNFNMNFPLVADQYNTNRWTVILIALDANRKPHDVAVSTFFTPEKDELWEDYAKAEYTDLIVGPSYLAFNPTYDVTVQRKKGTSGQLRVVNPYLNNPEIGDSYRAAHSAHNHYLYINADDPNYVYIEESPMGLDLGYGDVVASSVVGSMLNKRMALADIKSSGVQGGTLQGDDIVFPGSALCFFETKYKEGVLQPGEGGKLLHIKEYTSGVESTVVGNDDVLPARYFDLRGVEIERPAAGTVCIKVQGSKATKIIVQ